MSGNSFFRKFPEFLDSPVGAEPPRLAERYRRIIFWNREEFVGSNVLDLACHDGRWSVAAVDAGAATVAGVDRNPAVIDKARSICERRGISTISFTCVDAYEFLRTCSPVFDIVLCLGYFYHMPGHALMFEEFKRLAPKLLLLDTQLNKRQSRSPTIECFAEGGNDKPACSFERRVVGKPNHAFIRLLREVYLPSYSLERYAARGRRHESLSDYMRGTRHTYRFRRTQPPDFDN